MRLYAAILEISLKSIGFKVLVNVLTAPPVRPSTFIGCSKLLIN